jgi:8-oxo-dGTP pyrophosphatase MutT (NUDIX family)
MDQDRPDPEGPLDFEGEPATPREAATVIVLRGGAAALEVLMVRRNPAQRFMGGLWVFPGGAVDPGETPEAAGVREVQEESAVALAEPLVPYSRWITPAQIKIRFDTWFFLARAPEDADPRVDGSECVDWGWFTPAAALGDEAIGLAFPTHKTLQGLQRFGSVDEAIGWASGRPVEPVEPRVVHEGEVARVVLPGEPGYAD